MKRFLLNLVLSFLAVLIPLSIVNAQGFRGPIHTPIIRVTPTPRFFKPTLTPTPTASPTPTLTPPIFNYNPGSYLFDNGNYLEEPATNLPTGDSNRTLYARVYILSFLSDVSSHTNPLEAFFAGYGNFGNSNQTYQFGTAGDLLYFSQWGVSFNGPDLNTDTWYDVVVTNIGDNEYLYLDGSLVGEGTLTLQTPTTNDIYIGSIPAPLGTIRQLNGYVSVVQLYNYALSASQINEL